MVAKFVLAIVIILGIVLSAGNPVVQQRVTSALFPVKISPTPEFREAELDLNAQERATMSGDFLSEIRSVIASEDAQQGSVSGAETSRTHITPTPTRNPNASPTPSAKTTPSPTQLPTPTPTGDRQPPTVKINGGPSSTTGDNVCFPLWVTDNMTNYSKIMEHHRSDTGAWTDWATTLEPCVGGLAAGPHTFTVAVRDEAGNVSQEVSWSYSVAGK